MHSTLTSNKRDSSSLSTLLSSAGRAQDCNCSTSNRYLEARGSIPRGETFFCRFDKNVLYKLPLLQIKGAKSHFWHGVRIPSFFASEQSTRAQWKVLPGLNNSGETLQSLWNTYNTLVCCEKSHIG